MAKIYYDQDADPTLLEGHTIAIIGYGSQGHAHALNARDNGAEVIVGLYEGSRSREKAEAEWPGCLFRRRSQRACRHDQPAAPGYAPGASLW